MIHTFLSTCLCVVALAGDPRDVTADIAHQVRSDAHIWQTLPADAKSVPPVVLSLAFDGADGRLDDHTSLRAALIASGVCEAGELAALERRLEDAARELNRQID